MKDVLTFRGDGILMDGNFMLFGERCWRKEVTIEVRWELKKQAGADGGV